MKNIHVKNKKILLLLLLTTLIALCVAALNLTATDSADALENEIKRCILNQQFSLFFPSH